MYMVRFYNGHGVREKLFDSLAAAQEFKNKSDDKQAQIWQLVQEIT